MLGTLDSLEVGERAVVTAIYGRDDMKRRLLDIGMTQGLELTCVLKSPFGDPRAYWIKGATIALRNEDAENVMIEK